MTQAPAPSSKLVLFEDEYIRVTQTELSSGKQNPISIFRHLWFLRSGTEPALQGSLDINQPARPVLNYVARMLGGIPSKQCADAAQQPHIWVLGLGSGAAAHGAISLCPKALITAIDNNPTVIDLANQLFACPASHPQWRYVCTNASDWLALQTKVLQQQPTQRPYFVALDIYNAESQGPAIGLNGEYLLLSQHLSPIGRMAVNLHQQFGLADHLKALEHAFDGRVKVSFVAGEGNPVAYAYGASLWQTLFADGTACA